MAIYDTYREIEEALGVVPEWIKQMPEGGANGFWGVARDFWLADTKIPNKYKELIGLAVSGTTRCKYCTLFITKPARLFGAGAGEFPEPSLLGALTMMGSTFTNPHKSLSFLPFSNPTSPT